MTKAATLAAVGSVLTPDSSGNVSISGKKYQVSGVATNALAWVNFDGTTSPGTIRAQYNISSVTRNATGDYTVNITTALTDANYSYVVSQNGSYGSAQGYSASLNSSTPGTLIEVAPTTTAFRFTNSGSAGTYNPKYINVIVFGN